MNAVDRALEAQRRASEMEAKLAPYRKRFGEATKRENAELEAPDAREKWALVPLVVMAIVMGVAPMLFLRLSEKSVNSVRQSVVGTGEKSVSSVR